MRFKTSVIHNAKDLETNAAPIIPPISLASTYNKATTTPGEQFSYSRAANPNRQQWEEMLAQLEGGVAAAAFASGCAAAYAVLQALPGLSHVVAPQHMYAGIKNQMQQVFNGRLEFTFVDFTQPEQVKDAINAHTRLIWIETPANPLMSITDIGAIVNIAKAAGIPTVADNTFATPVLCNPLKFGVDIVLHSTSKYFGGHSDIIGGALITGADTELWKSIKLMHTEGGSIQSPFDSWLLLRSTKTLALRMQAHCENAAYLATHLQQNPHIKQVLYPGLAGFAGHELARSQMRDFGGVLSILINGTHKQAQDFLKHLRIIANATSLGGVESLAELRFDQGGIEAQLPDTLIRISAGIEDKVDLLTDITNALELACAR